MLRNSLRLTVRLLALWLLVLAFPGRSLAIIPTITSVTPTNPYSPANTMMYAVTVVVSGAFNDADHDAKVGFAVAGTNCAAGAWNFSHVERFRTSATNTWTLYNFQPGVAYDYKVEVGYGSPNTQCGSLGTPSLPTNLANLNLTYAGAGGFSTPYVVLDTDDCDSGGGPRRYLIAIDTSTDAIVWYLDVQARSTLGGSNLTGWRYQPGNFPPDTNVFLATVNRRYLYEWGWDGHVHNSKDYTSAACGGGAGATGPCISHDVYKSADTGHTYVVTSQVSATGIGGGTPWDGFAACDAGHHNSLFVNDGYEEYDGNYISITAPSSTNFLMTDDGYDPTVDGGPNGATSGQCDSGYWSSYFDSANGPIDWTHVNSVAALKPAAHELLDVSLHEWDQVIRIDTVTGALVWSLSGRGAGYSSLTLAKAGGIAGATDFAGQHDVHPESSDLLMFDNNGDANGSRVLRMTLTGGPPTNTATIVKSWQLVDATAMNALSCPAQGGGETVPGTAGANVLAMCSAEFTVEELNDSDGATGSAPLLHISLPNAGYCSSGGPGARSGINGWYRAFPVTAIGEF